jgi:acyl carrier protein
MTRDDIFAKVRDVLVDALAVDEDDVTPKARLVGDLGAESIDFLDIVFKLESAFGIKIPQGEMFPAGVAQNPAYVKDGKITSQGIAELKAKMPHFDFTVLDKDPAISRVADAFTVDGIVKFIAAKLGVH